MCLYCGVYAIVSYLYVAIKRITIIIRAKARAPFASQVAIESAG